jgi:hypothetical protein
MIITANSRPDLPDLVDDTTYVVTVTDVRLVEGKDYDDPDKPMHFLVIDLGLDPEAPELLSVWCTLKLGMTKSGVVSKLRQLLNALAGEPEATPIASFDSDLFTWSYPSGEVHELEVGNQLTVRGTNKITQAGDRRFTVDRFRPAPAAG